MQAIVQAQGWAPYLAPAKEFAKRLAATAGAKLFHMTLFGLRARGEADKESDLDLFVTLEGPDPVGTMKATARRIAFLEMIEEESIPLHHNYKL